MVAFELDIDWGRAAWLVLGAVLAATVAWVLYSFVGTFVFALFIYYSTRRVHGRIYDRVGQASVAASLALFALALPALLLLFYATAIGLQELNEFARTSDLGAYVEIAGPYLNVSELAQDPRALFDRAGGMDLVRSSLSQATSYLGLIATGLLNLFVMLAVAFYLLRDDHRLAAWGDQFGRENGVLDEFTTAVDDSLERIFAGNILNAIVTATVAAIVYSLLGVAEPEAFGIPYAALVGLLTGIASLVPVVGIKLVYVPVTIYLAAMAASEGTGWGFVVLFAVVSFVVVDTIPDLVVRPYVSGGDLHTGSVMFAYILGPLLFGWYGLFLGPFILVFVTHFAGIIVPRLLPRGDESPAGVDPVYLNPPPAQKRQRPAPDPED